MAVAYFLDTYAIYEMMAGNPDYSDYFGEENRTSMLNIAEVYYRILLDSDEATADDKTLPLLPFAIPIGTGTVKRAMIFKFENRQKKFSYADSIGYALARERGLLFLTGDKEFKDLSNVEYVK